MSDAVWCSEATKRSFEAAIDWRRALNDVRNASIEAADRIVCPAIDWIVARVFFTR
jgi:hypothetical protein